MMTVSTVTLSPGTPGHLRPLNVLRDLPAVADLIEVCFHSTMDAEGRQYLQNIRRSATDSRFLHWAQRVADTVSLPLSGYVWDIGGKIVGNVSLIPYNKRGYRTYLIANVATHPDYRRRGIARLLTDIAVQHARDKHTDSIWLHVRDDNPGAVALYQELGFIERYRRSNWYSKRQEIPQPLPDYFINRRKVNDWQQQRQWLARLYPEGLFWYYTNHWEMLRPGLLNAFSNFVKDISIDQWSVYQNDVLRNVVSLERSYGKSDNIWAALPPVGADEALSSALLAVQRFVGAGRTLTLDFPAYEAVDAIQAAGFDLARTLIWMEAPGVQRNL
jgi:GNAT superfamily N-acetyltransferase